MGDHDGALFAQVFLEHHGIKGMHWGSRKSAHDGPVRVSGSFGEGGKAVIKTAGGGGQPPHEDAIAAKVIEQKLKQSGSHALSNYELRRLQERQNLEQSVTRLQGGHTDVKSATKKVREFLRSPEGRTSIKVAKAAANSPKVKRAAATVAATAAMR